MPIACPTSSTLPCFCIGGQLSTTCCDDAGEWPTLRVTTSLIGAGNETIIDPSNCATIVATMDERIITDSQGCWSTCQLPANFNGDDPELALQPSGLSWEIKVFAQDGDNGAFNLVAGPFVVAIDGAEDYDALGDCCLLTGPSGEQCINITCLLEALPTNPPTARFCDSVAACLNPISGTGLLANKITGSYEDGWIANLECADIDGCLPDLLIRTDGTALGVAQSGDHDHTANIVVTSTDAGQIATIGDDGGTFIDCAAVVACIGTITGTGLLANKITGDPAAGWIANLECADIDGCLPDVVFTTDGNATGVTQSGPHDHVVNAVLRSTDADQILTTGADGGLFLSCATVASCITIPDAPVLSVVTDGTATGVTVNPLDDHDIDVRVTSADAGQVATIGADGGTLVTCETINGCVNFTYVEFDPLTHDAGMIEGAGTIADPYQIPLPTIDVEITGIAITNTVVNADGSTTVTYTVTETDDGDADPATHNFDVVFPAAAELNFEYVTFDPALHGNGTIEGAGTTADPFQIPVCCDTYQYVTYDPAVHAAGTLVGAGTAASPYQIPLPTATTEPDEYEYVEFDSAVHTAGTLAGSGTTAAPYQIPLPTDICDLLDDLTAASQTAAATDEILVIQTDGTCARKTIPSGTTDTNTTYTLDDNDTAAIRLVDDQNTLISSISLCDLVDDITQVGTAPTGGLVLTYDPVADACSLAPAATGGTVDICAELATVTDAATWSPTLPLVTNDCEVITAGDVQPDHVLTSQSVPASACNDLTGGTVTSSVTSMTDQDAGGGQLGTLVIGPSFIDAADIAPISVTLPPATVGCVQFVQVSWGGRNNPPDFFPDLGQFVAAGNMAGDVANLTQVVPQTLAWSGTARTQVFAVDVTGTGGGSLDITFPDADAVDPYEGVINWMVYEACGFTVSDLDVGSSVSTVAVGSNDATNSPGDLSPAPAIDMGSCDAVFFGVGRHVGPNTSGVPSETPGDDPWSPSTPAVNQVAEIATFSFSSQCQIGVTAGWIDADTGPVTFSHVGNTSFIAGDPAQWVAIPLSCSTAGGGACETVEASLDTTNPACNGPSRQRVDVTGNICVSVSPGSRIEITPTIAGTDLDPIVFDNTGNADGIETCIPYQYTETLAAVIPSGTAAATLTASFSAEETNGTGNAGDAVVFNEWTLESELIHA